MSKAVCYRMMLVLAVAVCGELAGAEEGKDDAWAEDPGMESFLRFGLPIPNRHDVKTFDPQENRANFTLFHGVENVAVRGGKLCFMMGEEGKATLGWGNYMGRQEPQEVKDLWESRNNVHLQVRQSCEESSWEVGYWANGAKHKGISRARGKRYLQTAKGTKTQELVFRHYGPYNPIPDGLEITIDAEPGATFEIDKIQFVRGDGQDKGCVRTEFVLPEGDVWKAVADAAGGNERMWAGRREFVNILYLNGQRVERRTPRGLYASTPVDIAQYLKPGVNCAAYYCRNVSGVSLVALNATIIMESGEIIKVSTADRAAWTYSPEKAKGWNEPGFDDDSWQELPEGRGPRVTWPTHQRVPPADTSFFMLRHPGDRELFYNDTRDVHVDVHIPFGCREHMPVLEYAVGRAMRDGTSEILETGTWTEYEAARPSLVYRLNLGKREHGVYTLHLRLRAADGTVLGRRPREPFMVLRKSAQPEIDGKSFTEGLDVTLVDTIDCIDGEDGHEWIEGAFKAFGQEPAQSLDTPRIVRKDGLEYREVQGEGHGSYISWRLGAFAHPGDFYLFEVDYPDNRERGMEITVTHPQREYTSESGVGAESGGKYYITGEMKTLRWLHVADTGVHGIHVKTLFDHCPAAVKSIRIYHVKGGLPAVRSGEGRKYGIHSERQFYGNGFGRIFGMDTPYGRMDRDERKAYDESHSVMERNVRKLVWLQETADRYVQYLRFAGQNLSLVGCIQYNEFNTPFVPADKTASPRITCCPRNVLIRALDVNGIDALAGIEYSDPLNLFTPWNDTHVAKGRDTVYKVDATGRQDRPGASGGSKVAYHNWMHPEYFRHYLNVVNDILDTFADIEHFRGIADYVSLGGIFHPANASGRYETPLRWGFDDHTWRAFEADEGLQLSIEKDDPARFMKRGALLEDAGMRERFLAWRARAFADMIARAREHMLERRSDLEWVTILYNNLSMMKEMLESGQDFESFVRDFGLDMQRLGQADHQWIVRRTINWRSWRQHQDPYAWVPKERDSVISAYEDLPRRAVLCRTSWHETRIFAPGVKRSRNVKREPFKGLDWFMTWSTHRTHPQPSGRHAREAAAHAIITGGPQILLSGFTDVMLNIGHEQTWRDIVIPFTMLPSDRFDRVLDTGLDTTLAIRTLNRDHDAWLVIANPGYWPIQGTVTLSSSAPLLNVWSGEQVCGAGDQTLDVRLAPYGLAAFRCDAAGLRVAGYATGDIPGRELAHMQGIVDRVDTLLDDPRVQLVLSPEDRGFMQGVVDGAARDIEGKEYARAWHRITVPTFWRYWKDYLEKAAVSMAMLPDRFRAAKEEVDEQGLRTMTAVRAAGAVSVDGKLDDAAWRPAAFQGGFRTKKDRCAAMNQTAVSVTYDETALYVAFVCADRAPEDLKSTATDEKGVFLSKDDALIVFVQPDGSVPVYYQMAFNAGGVLFDQEVKGGERNYGFAPDWDAACFKGDGYWTAEARLPLAAFDVSEPAGSTWRVNFFRVMRNGELDPCEWQVMPGSWHDPKHLGMLRFET